LNAHKRFAVPTYAPVLNNLTVIVVFLAFHQIYGKVGLNATDTQLLVIGLGTTLGVVLMALAQLPFLRNLGRYRWTISPRHPVVMKVLRLSLYVFGFVAVSQLGFLFMQWLANAQRGGYSAYVTAYTFFLLPISLFGVSIITALLPDLSAHAANQRWDGFRERLSVGLRATSFLVIPAAVGYLLLGKDILDLILRFGVVTGPSIDLISQTLVFLVLGLPQVAIFGLFVRGFYAMQDARTPFFIVSAVVVLNAAINVPLFSAMEVEGLALGHSIAHSFAIAACARVMAGRIGGMDGARIGRSLARITFAAAGMGLAVWAARAAIPDVSGWWPQTSELAAELGVGLIAYLVIAHLIRVEELTYVKRLFRRNRVIAQGG
jgi:putative peptidoglycan lipid II flippase